ncbi:MAG: isoprenylcysteine carboxylmethyltransferase family protein [Candidatus Omnitrophica bacterium]|nr:isoprenylcysteine carboxylmethyltransferase family protein [Candidatus Omnitrophota bacterium]
MKERVKIDHTLLVFVVVLTGILYQLPQLYFINRWGDNILDFLGFFLILKGMYWRMAARGHKRAHSARGEGLVITGLYQVVRNPMYLGTFLLGVGFVFIVWPWWSFPIFTWLFYIRFMRQVTVEEAFLKKRFGKSYEDYCQQVPRLLPSWQNCKSLDIKRVFPWEETWSTQEKRGLLIWPFLAFLFEILQEKIVFQVFHPIQALFILFLAGCVFAAGIFLWYRRG